MSKRMLVPQLCSSMFLLSVILLLAASSVFAQSTSFGYQGKFTDSGNPASGNYDFQFKLFDALTAGVLQGSPNTVTKTGVNVTNGVFTVELDFGASGFSGAARFLEIAVKSTGGSFTTLSPRQPVTSMPYTIRSLNAATAAAADGLSVACVNCVTSSQIQSVNGSQISGAIPVASVPAGSGNYIQNTTNQQTASNFNISDNGIIGGNAGIGTSTPTQRLSVNGNVEIMGSGNKLVGANGDVTFTGNLGDGSGGLRLSNVGGVDVIIDSDSNDSSRAFRVMNNGADRSTATTLLAVTDGGSVGIGTAVPTRQLEQSAAQAIARLTSTSNISGGSVLELRNATASPALLGAINFQTSGSTPGQIAYRAADNALTFNTNSAEQVRIDSAGKLGIGTTAPAHRLTIGTGTNTGVTTADLAVFGASGAYATVRDTTNNIEALFGADNTAVGGTPGAALYGSMTNHGIQFRTGNASRMAITPAGDVGIGTNNPAARLDVAGDIAFAPQTTYLSVSPVAFNPEDGGYGFVQNDSFIQPKPFFPNVFQQWRASVNLPDGATVTEFRVLIDEDDDAQNVRIDLNRRAHDDSSAGVLASVTSNTTSSSNPTKKFYTDATIEASVIDNSTYTYSVSFFVITDRFFIGAVRIKYTYTHP